MAMGLGLEENFFVEKYISDPFWVIRIIGTPHARWHLCTSCVG
jgi:isopenicillin N synthase-like dioxygenase